MPVPISGSAGALPSLTAIKCVLRQSQALVAADSANPHTTGKTQFIGRGGCTVVIRIDDGLAETDIDDPLPIGVRILGSAFGKSRCWQQENAGQAAASFSAWCSEQEIRLNCTSGHIVLNVIHAVYGPSLLLRCNGEMSSASACPSYSSMNEHSM